MILVPVIGWKIGAGVAVAGGARSLLKYRLAAGAIETGHALGMTVLPENAKVSKWDLALCFTPFALSGLSSVVSAGRKFVSGPTSLYKKAADESVSALANNIKRAGKWKHASSALKEVDDLLDSTSGALTLISIGREASKEIISN